MLGVRTVTFCTEIKKTPISSGIAESAVNQVLSMRMAKTGGRTVAGGPLDPQQPGAAEHVRPSGGGCPEEHRVLVLAGVPGRTRRGLVVDPFVLVTVHLRTPLGRCPLDVATAAGRTTERLSDRRGQGRLPFQASSGQ